MKVRNPQLILFVLPMLALAACSERGSYQSVRESRAFECQNLPESERERCERNLMPEYDEYQREREAQEDLGKPEK